MRLVYFELEDFRNYDRLSLSFGPHLNCLVGGNAQGKTNLIEAIFTLCLGKSFRTNSDSELLRFGSQRVRIFGQFVSDAGTEHNLALQYGTGEGKQVHCDRKRVTRISRIVGQFPVVLLSPAHYSITLGGPAERRQFVDTLLAQSGHRYLHSWQNYLRAVKQRNKILSNCRAGIFVSEDVLDSWDQNVLEWGCSIVSMRQSFVEEFGSILARKYEELTGSSLQLSLTYEPWYLEKSSRSLIDAFHEALRKAREKERSRGMTLVGPHRDDFVFSVNGTNLRKFGSRGEHKTVLMAIKFAEYEFLCQKRNETPILLLDDVFSELDLERKSWIHHAIEKTGQVFLTTTDSTLLWEIEKGAVYRVRNGAVISNGSS